MKILTRRPYTLQQGPRGGHSFCQTLTPKLLHDRPEVEGGSVRGLEDIYLPSGCKNSLYCWIQVQRIEPKVNFFKTFYLIYYGWVEDSMHKFYSVYARIRGQPCGIGFLLTPLYGSKGLNWGPQTCTAGTFTCWALSLARSQYFNNNKAIPCLCWLLAERKFCLLHMTQHTCTYANINKKHNWSWSCRGLLPSLHSGLHPGSPFLLIYTIYKYVYSRIHVCACSIGVEPRALGTLSTCSI